MKRATIALTVAALAFVTSWLVPVVEDGTILEKGAVPGWEAFRLALSPVWSYRGLRGSGSFSDLLGVISALTNAWFIVALALLAFFPPRANRGLLWGLLAAALVNSLWAPSAYPGALRLGYYLWVGSFLVLAAAAWRVSRGARSGATPGAA